MMLTRIRNTAGERPGTAWCRRPEAEAAREDGPGRRTVGRTPGADVEAARADRAGLVEDAIAVGVGRAEHVVDAVGVAFDEVRRTGHEGDVAAGGTDGRKAAPAVGLGPGGRHAHARVLRVRHRGSEKTQSHRHRSD
jgi:hypothetical protein